MQLPPDVGLSVTGHQRRAMTSLYSCFNLTLTADAVNINQRNVSPGYACILARTSIIYIESTQVCALLANFPSHILDLDTVCWSCNGFWGWCRLQICYSIPMDHGGRPFAEPSHHVLQNVLHISLLDIYRLLSIKRMVNTTMNMKHGVMEILELPNFVRRYNYVCLKFCSTSYINLEYIIFWTIQFY